MARCEKLRDGGLEVEFRDEKDAENAMRATVFTYTVRDAGGKRQVRLSIHVSPHRTKNSSRGVIFCPDLADMEDEETATGLYESGVAGARRIRTKNGGALVPPHSIILAFDSADLPKEVHVGYEVLKVRPYVPSPMRCFRCLRFGHTRDYCKGKSTCGTCASVEHTSDVCTAETPKCVNCDESQTPHSAFSPSCPALQKEKDILTIKTTRKIGFREARDLYNAAHPKRSYASVAKPAEIPLHPENDQQALLAKLIEILQSFGLRPLVASGSPAPPTTVGTQTDPALILSASPPLPPPPHGAPPPPLASDAAPPTGASAASSDCAADAGGEWIEVRKGRAKPSPKQPSPIPPRSTGTAVQQALRRRDDELRNREEKRAQLFESAGRLDSARKALSVSPSGSGSPPRMPPPPPPPPLPRRAPAGLPPPPDAPAPGLRLQPEVPAPESPLVSRPLKRPQPGEGSPTDSGSPRSRPKFQPGSTGRARSADGRLREGHPRVVFGDGPVSGGQESF